MQALTPQIARYATHLVSWNVGAAKTAPEEGRRFGGHEGGCSLDLGVRYPNRSSVGPRRSRSNRTGSCGTCSTYLAIFQE